MLYFKPQNCNALVIVKIMLAIGKNEVYSYVYEQDNSRKARPNPHHAGRGIVDAFGVPRVRRIDQYGYKAIGGRRNGLRGLPR